jgi:hypothetical protein
MKKLMLVTGLCVGLFVVAPVASANAETGTCTLEGNTSFPEGLKAKASYTFEATPGTHCAGTGGPSTIVKASVHGKGELSCTAGSGTGGEGEIELSNGSKQTFTDFEFTSAGTEVSFTIPSIKAHGHASFAGDATGVAKCAKGEGELIRSLKFTAQAQGEI